MKRGLPLLLEGNFSFVSEISFICFLEDDWKQEILFVDVEQKPPRSSYVQNLFIKPRIELASQDEFLFPGLRVPRPGVMRHS